MEMKDYFEQLKRDYDSSLTPSSDDPKTQETMRHIAVGIYRGRCTIGEFYKFVDEKLEHGDFAKEVKEFVENEIDNLKRGRMGIND